MAVYPKNKDYIINENLLMQAPNKLTKLIPGSETWAESIYVVDTSEIKKNHSIYMHVNALEQHGTIFIGY